MRIMNLLFESSMESSTGLNSCICWRRELWGGKAQVSRECRKSITPSFLCSLRDCVLCVLALSWVLVWEIQLLKPARLRGKCHSDFIALLLKTVKHNTGGLFPTFNKRY